MILAQLSDPHLEVGPGDRRSTAALAAAVAAVIALRPHPDAVLVSGDLAEHASAAEYERTRELLAPLPMPVHVLPGNHDDRDLLRAHFPLAEPAAPGAEYRYTADVEGVRLVACDSTVPGHVHGALDVAWLQAQLDAPRVLVAMHHPPIGAGMPALDDFALGAHDRGALAELLAGSPQVLRVVAGHFHRAAFGVLGGCGVATCPSLHLAARLEIGSPVFDTVAEPPAFALHVALDGTVVSHVQPIDRA